ncbi:MAG TPA: carboxylating nicotinate-nucleotide diphosphorylase [Bacillota bacterium]|nr:carboxylating nicotinate-nucleotide diphosphorylase [Bacillota bacterium]
MPEEMGRKGRSVLGLPWILVEEKIRQALQEDMPDGDITTESMVDSDALGQVELICKEDGILCGLEVFHRVFYILDPKVKMTSSLGDGVEVLSGQVVAILHGNLRALLSGERTALNFLQRMTGIATMTKEWSALLEGTGTRLIDTRKTTPNMRVLEKYAVRIGGGQNHRSGLSDGILIKDNHIAAAGSIGNAISLARVGNSFQRKIEVEVESLEMVKEALEAGADIIMLDNMEMSLMKEAIGIIGGRALTECSGNVTKKRIPELAGLGLDFISCGALTHSARICDFSMKHLRKVENL